MLKISNTTNSLFLQVRTEEEKRRDALALWFCSRTRTSTHGGSYVSRRSES